MANTPAAGRRRDPFHLLIRPNAVVRMQLFPDIYNGGLGAALGITAAPAEIPQGTSVVGINRQDALRNGALPIRVAYQATATRRQSATVLCSPTRADTIFQQALSTTYKGRNIVNVLPARRRIFTV